jgi:hypothetical protein
MSYFKQVREELGLDAADFHTYFTKYGGEFMFIYNPLYDAGTNKILKDNHNKANQTAINMMRITFNKL